MRVLFLTTELFSNNKACYNLLAQYCLESDLQIEVLTISEDEKYHMLEMAQNVIIHRLPFSRKNVQSNFSSRLSLWFFQRKIYSLAKKINKKNSFDVVHLFGVMPSGQAAIKLKSKLKLPYVVSIREGDVIEKTNFRIGKIKRVINKSDLAVTSTEAYLNTATKYKFNKEINIVRDGIDASHFVKLRNDSSGKINLICGTQLIPTSGIRLIIQAVAILVKRYPELGLIVVGEGSEKESLMHLTRALEIEQNVQFVGDVSPEKKIEVYSSADIFVSAHLEGRMNELMLECMSLSMPLLATDLLFVKEYLKEGDNGFLLKFDDYNDIAEKTEKLLLDKNLLERMSRQSRIYAEQISHENIAHKYLELYKIARNIGKIKQD